MSNLYPTPEAFEVPPGKMVMHQRARIVIQQPTFEDATALAENLSEECACDVEVFFAASDGSCDKNLGEVVLGRKFYPCKGAMAPAEETEAKP